MVKNASRRKSKQTIFSNPCLLPTQSQLEIETKVKERDEKDKNMKTHPGFHDEEANTLVFDNDNVDI
jgi:hypothetical protein